MINYIEKGRFLHEHLAALGYELTQSQDGDFHAINVFNSSEQQSQTDATVNQIIADFNPWPLAKAEAKARIIDEIRQYEKAITSLYPEIEKTTFGFQRTEAEVWQSATDKSSVSTPYLDDIASKTGATIADVVQNVLTKAAEYRIACTNVIAARKNLSAAIDAHPETGNVSELGQYKFI